MLFDIHFGLGRNVANPRIRRMLIPESLIMSVGTFAGSYHVHSMDRHYRDYIVHPTFPILAASAALHPDFPNNFSYRALEEKQSSPGISGNIGEALGGIAGRELFKLGPRQIVHIVPIKGKIKAPDFIFHFDPVPSEARTFLQAAGVAPLLLDNAAVWWPAEAKARKKGQAKAAFKEAFAQLIAYWWELLESGANVEDVGYGMILIAEYGKATPTLTVHFLVPRAAQRIQKYFGRLHARKSSPKKLSAFIRKLSARGTGNTRLNRIMRLFHG